MDQTPVHTMPERFMQQSAPLNTPPVSSSGGGGKFKSLLPLLIIIIIVLLILGGVAIYLFYRLDNQSNVDANANTNAVVVNQNTNQQNTNTVLLNNNGNANQQNSNTNVNANLNSNSNSNRNVNAQTNAATNSQVNKNSNSGTNINATEQVTSSVDSDNDLLTDVEEEIFSTNPDKPDSDSDGYLDGQELLAGYNPMGSGQLAASEALDVYANDQFNYQITYPVNWTIGNLDQEKRTILFTSDTGEFVEVSVTENDDQLTATQWYLELYPDLEASDLKSVTTLDEELIGVQSLAGYTVYFADNQYVYSLNYNFGIEQEINFLTTFKIMYLSFQLTAEEQTNQNTNNNNSNA